MRKLAIAVVLSAAASLAAAQQPGVARLSLIHGEVSTQNAGSGDWVAGAINAPLVSGDGIATAADARGEVQLDFADTLRLDENAQATLANLSESGLQVQVGQGLVDFVETDGASASPEIDTPNLGVHPQRAGVYRIQVNSDAESVVTVRSGEAEISTPQGNATLHAGQSIIVQGSSADGGEPQYQITEASQRDDWDQWNQDRDRSIAAASSWTHANRYYTGVEDLDGYGRWVVVPGYGSVWAPTMDAGWTPYSMGRWVYEPYWGWTWVSSEAWGWAPYHYGRWFYYGSSWVWWPGPVRETPLFRPVWAPAYVSFIGLHRGGVSVGVGFGSIGWLPIGPADPYRPWGGGRMMAPLGSVGIGIGVRLRYSNLDRMGTDPVMARALVTVPTDRFGRGPVARVAVTREEIRQGSVMSGRLPVEPVAASRRASDRVVNPSNLPRAAVERPSHFYGTRAPVAAAARPAPAPGARAGFHSFGENGSAPRPAAPTARSGTQSGTKDPNWHQFRPETKTAPQPGRGEKKERDKKEAKPKPVPHEGGGGR